MGRGAGDDRRWFRDRLAIGIAAAAAALVLLLAPSTAPAAGNGPVLFSDYNAIWSIQADGSGLKRVAKTKAWSLHASPNGRTLAFTHGGLYLMPIGGGKIKNVLKRYPIVDGLAGVDWASWAPNGKRIVFAGSNDTRIYTVKPNGKGLRYLFNKNRTGLMRPVWSPNGREIAFIDVWNDSSLMAVDVASGKERMIYSGSGPAGTPVDFDWHPSGQRIAFYAPYRNWMINSDGSGLRQISPNAAFVSYEDLVFSPDGSQLVGRTVAEGGTTSELWLMDGNYGSADGGYVREITGAFGGSAFFPEWAPARR